MSDKVQITVVPPSAPATRSKPVTVIFALPGRGFSGRFLRNWSNTLMALPGLGIIPRLAQEYDPVVYYVRNKCLGGNVLSGKNQKPYQGKVEYDYIMWIDSDIVFDVNQIMKLLSRNLPIVAGLYMMSDQRNFAAVKDWDIDYFSKNGAFKFLTPADTEGKTDPIEVAYSGFGFMLVKKGVFESVEYPWFRPVMHNLDANNKDIVDFSSEDSSMCWIFREKGHKIFVDPTVRVGHEKELVL